MNTDQQGGKPVSAGILVEIDTVRNFQAPSGAKSFHSAAPMVLSCSAGIPESAKPNIRVHPWLKIHRRAFAAGLF